MTDPNSQTPDPTQALKIANAITCDAAKIKDVACAIMDVADGTGDDADELYALARKIWDDAERIRDLGFKIYGRYVPIR